MRLLLALLVVLNVVLSWWIWHEEQGANPMPEQPRTKPDFGQIRLIQNTEVGQAMPAAEKDTTPSVAMTVKSREPGNFSEARQEQLETSAAITSEPVGVFPPSPHADSESPATFEEESDVRPSPAYCGELGPFASRNIAEAYRQGLASGKARAHVEDRPGKETIGYWVMISRMPDTAAAEAMLQRLRQAGLTDLWLMRQGEHKNAISLGLYTQERYAYRHAETIRDKGFDPVVVPKQKSTRLYWVVYSGADEAVLSSLGARKLPANVALMKNVCDQALTAP